MDWEDRKVLVTGGAGFIGSHLVEKLLDLGSEVHVADNFSRGSLDNIKPFLEEIHLHPLDLRHFENCVKATENVDWVFHLAASVGGIHYIKKENVGGLTPSLEMNTNMLESARINDIKRFLFTSSACVYREETEALSRFKEEDAYPSNPLTTYGWAKLLGEIQCQAYQEDYGIKCALPRIFNAYGPKENLDPQWSHVIPSFIRKAILYPEVEFEIFGDGTQERGFLYVKDCVEGLIRCIEKKADGKPVNLGNDNVITINELAKRIIALSGKDIEVKHDLSAPEGTTKYCANTTKMKNELGWQPETSLDTGLRRTFEWTKSELK